MIEKFLIDGGTILIKLWLEVGNDEQKRRFEQRIKDPVRQWKLSPMDLPSRKRWYDYSHARDVMLKMTDTRSAPWYIVKSDDKKSARLNAIAHILSLIPYKKLPREKVKLPSRSNKGKYDDTTSIARRKFVKERVLNAGPSADARTAGRRRRGGSRTDGLGQRPEGSVRDGARHAARPGRPLS